MGIERRDKSALIHDYYRALIENSLDLIILMDTDATIKFISASVEKVLGYTPQEIVGTCIFEYIQYDEIKLAKILFDRLVTNPWAKEYFECHAERKDGTWLDMEAVGESFLEHPCINGIVVNARDITRRKKAEEELCKSDKRFKAIIDSIPEVITISNEEGDIECFGASVYQVLGHTPEEAEAINIYDLIHPDDLEGVIFIVLSVSEKPGARATFRCRMKHKDGRWVHSETTVINYTDNPAIAGNLFVGRDVTESVMEGERLEEALKDLIESASHELRQHLTILKAYSSMLQTHRNRFDEADLDRIFQVMETSSDRMNEMMNGMSYAEDS